MGVIIGINVFVNMGEIIDVNKGLNMFVNMNVHGYKHWF